MSALDFLVTIEVAVLTLFHNLDLDTLIAVRTCLYQSWTNLAEQRVMKLKGGVLALPMHVINVFSFI